MGELHQAALVKVQLRLELLVGVTVALKLQQY